MEEISCYAQLKRNKDKKVEMLLNAQAGLLRLKNIYNKQLSLYSSNNNDGGSNFLIAILKRLINSIDENLMSIQNGDYHV